MIDRDTPQHFFIFSVPDVWTQKLHCHLDSSVVIRSHITSSAIATLVFCTWSSSPSWWHIIRITFCVVGRGREMTGTYDQAAMCKWSHQSAHTAKATVSAHVVCAGHRQQSVMHIINISAVYPYCLFIPAPTACRVRLSTALPFEQTFLRVPHRHTLPPALVRLCTSRTAATRAAAFSSASTSVGRRHEVSILFRHSIASTLKTWQRGLKINRKTEFPSLSLWSRRRRCYSQTGAQRLKMRPLETPGRLIRQYTPVWLLLWLKICETADSNLRFTDEVGHTSRQHFRKGPRWRINGRRGPDRLFSNSQTKHKLWMGFGMRNASSVVSQAPDERMWMLTPWLGKKSYMIQLYNIIIQLYKSVQIYSPW